MSIRERAARLLAAITSPPWQVVEDCYEPSEKHGQLAGRVAQRRIFTTWDHPQLKGPLGVVNGYVTIAKVCGSQPHHGVRIEEGDAQFIAAAPELVRDLLAEGDLTKHQELITRARRWLSRQCDGEECATCGAPENTDHEPTDPCGIIAELLFALTGAKTWPAPIDGVDA